MKNIVIIAAIGKDRELGKNNSLIWTTKEDMTFFRNTTINHHVVMGRKTFESLPKLLPNRVHIVLTRSNLNLPEEVIKIASIDEFIKQAPLINDTIYVIGGGSIYTELMPYSDKMILTEIDDICPEADTYFPEFHKEEWNTETIGEYQEQEVKYLRKVYTRKQ